MENSVRATAIVAKEATDRIPHYSSTAPFSPKHPRRPPRRIGTSVRISGMNNSPPDIALFVYGTLKKGFPAHEHFFGEDADDIEEAVVRGNLFDLPAGYPALAVPQKNILAIGAATPLDDAEKRRGVRLAEDRSLPAPEETVHGEIVRFGDSERILPALDAFEGFDPEGGSLYVRVLTTAWTASGEACPTWAYVMESPLGKPLPDGKWPPSGKDYP